MSDTKETAKLLKRAIKEISVYKNKISAYNGKTEVITPSNISVDILSRLNTEELKPYVKEHGLDKPENMAKFLVEMHFACFDSINEGIGKVRGDLLNTTMAAVDSVKTLINFADDNPAMKDEKLSECITMLTNAQSDLKLKIKEYTGEIETFDNRVGMAFFVRAKAEQKNIHAAFTLATAAMQAYFEVANLFAFIGVIKPDVNVSIFLNNTEEFISYLKDKKRISLMASYDKAKDDSYWDSTNFEKYIENIRNVSEDLLDLYDDSDGEEVDLENDVIF